jgi:general stress protein 26
MDQAQIYDFLKHNRLGVVSSLSTNGIPQSALVGIAVTPALEIIFDTLKSSRKYANLRGDPRCSLVVGWEGEQTIQIEGVAAEPIGSELARLQAAYFEVWPDGRARKDLPGIAWLVVRATWCRYSDYDQSPPLIWEAKLDHPSQ